MTFALSISANPNWQRRKICVRAARESRVDDHPARFSASRSGIIAGDFIAEAVGSNLAPPPAESEQFPASSEVTYYRQCHSCREQDPADLAPSIGVFAHEKSLRFAVARLKFLRI
jgi:hypothetical protein